jgi:hypothetical protein
MTENAGPEKWLPYLADYAAADRPTLFAIYGNYRNEELGSLCGWGMEWGPSYDITMFYQPDTRQTWRSTTAESVLSSYRIFSDAHLLRFQPGEVQR